MFYCNVALSYYTFVGKNRFIYLCILFCFFLQRSRLHSFKYFYSWHQYWRLNYGCKLEGQAKLVQLSSSSLGLLQLNIYFVSEKKVKTRHVLSAWYDLDHPCYKSLQSVWPYRYMGQQVFFSLIEAKTAKHCLKSVTNPLFNNSTTVAETTSNKTLWLSGQH